MVADVWLIVEFLGLLVAAALAAWSIAKSDLRPMIAAAAVAACAWLLAACLNGQRPYERLGVITLHVQLLDAATTETVRDATALVVAQDDAGETTRYRLPATVVQSDGPGTELVRLSVFAQRQISGSLFEQFSNPAMTNQVVDQKIEVVAPGYQTWRGTLKQLLPKGWPDADRPAPIVLKLDRQD